MRSGDLRHTVKLQTPQTTESSSGATSTAWPDVGQSFRAAIDTLNVRERFMAAQEHGSATHRIRTRYRADLAAANGKERIVFGSRIFPLVGPATNVNERNREVHFLVEEGLKDG